MLALALAACGQHPHPHPSGVPSTGGSATPVEPPPDAAIEPAAPAAPTGGPTTDPAPPTAGAAAPTTDDAFCNPPTRVHHAGEAPTSDDPSEAGGFAGCHNGTAVVVAGGDGNVGAIGGGGGRNAYDYGNGRVPTAPQPTITIAVPKVSGGGLLDSVVHRHLRMQRPRFADCYVKALAVHPGAAGVVAIDLTIGPDGLVVAASAHGVDDDLAGCDAAAAKATEFPDPTNGKPVKASFTIRYAPPPS